MQLTIHHYPNVASTQTTAKDYLALGAEEGTVIIADEQTAGRGQFGRVWQSLNGNLHCSLIHYYRNRVNIHCLLHHYERKPQEFTCFASFM